MEKDCQPQLALWSQRKFVDYMNDSQDFEHFKLAPLWNSWSHWPLPSSSEHSQSGGVDGWHLARDDDEMARWKVEMPSWHFFLGLELGGKDGSQLGMLESSA